jgi:hypothetical protein
VFEHLEEMEATQAGEPRQVIESDILVQIRFHVLVRVLFLAAIKPA